jgi:energy-coupling factor transporter transmembrane protein EcfT
MGLRLLCLGIGTVFLIAGRHVWVPGIGMALTAVAFFCGPRQPRRIRSLLKWMIPVLVFLGGYGFLLSLTAEASSPEYPVGELTGLFLRSVGMVFAVLVLEETLRPLALRARAKGPSGGRMALMLGLSYQLVPVFFQSLEGVALAQRARSRLWWTRPGGILRACSSVFMLSHRLSEELALSLSLRLGHAGPSATQRPGDISGSPMVATPANRDLETPGLVDVE